MASLYEQLLSLERKYSRHDDEKDELSSPSRKNNQNKEKKLCASIVFSYNEVSITMLAKKNRLNREAFNKVFSHGKRFHGETMQLIVAPSPTFHGSVVVGKKVFSHAVQRNKLRRRIYAQLAAHQNESAYTCIVIVKPTIKTLPVAKIKEEIVGLLKKAK